MDESRQRILTAGDMPADVSILGEAPRADHALSIAGDGEPALRRARPSGRNRGGEPLEA